MALLATPSLARSAARDTGGCEAAADRRLRGIGAVAIARAAGLLLLVSGSGSILVPGGGRVFERGSWADCRARVVSVIRRTSSCRWVSEKIQELIVVKARLLKSALASWICRAGGTIEVGSSNLLEAVDAVGGS